jgi:hypothetical protein
MYLGCKFFPPPLDLQPLNSHDEAWANRKAKDGRELPR